MKPPNENGVYEVEVVDELARRGRAHAGIRIAQCTDGLYRFALDAMFSDRASAARSLIVELASPAPPPPWTRDLWRC